MLDHKNLEEVAYGDWQLGPLTPESISIISVCRKRE